MDQPPAVSLHSQTCGLGLLKTEIGTALCAIGAGGTFLYIFFIIEQCSCEAVADTLGTDGTAHPLINSDFKGCHQIA